ncbi:MAG: HAMP domain-containing protein [Clostridia bacterium]|nr:HAMP domain-containing protein [Clostridia bacterium]
MFFKSLQLKMILLFFAFVLVSLVAVGTFSVLKMEQVYYRGFAEEMLNTISSFGININSIGETEQYEDVNREELEKENLNKIYSNFSAYFSLNNISRSGKILDKDGNVLFSSKNSEITPNMLQCINEAKQNRMGYAVFNDTESQNYLFAYVITHRLENEGEIEYIIVIEQSKDYINTQLNEVRLMYGTAIVIITFIAIIVSVVFASNITRPIDTLTKEAEKIARGDIDQVKFPDKSKSGYEISKLIQTFSDMTMQIKNNLNEISSEKSKFETILLHLTDGVLVFNLQGETIHANLAAKKIFKLKGNEKFEDIFGNYKIDINMEKIIYLDDWTSSEQMVNVGDIFVNMFFAPFRDEKEHAIGVIVVIQDITKQAKLDDMRKEFVANVSHELKTPLTSIKTYTETLLDQEIDKESENRFLNVILTEANRMTRLVSDLLQLTKFDYKKVAWNKVDFDLPVLVKQICEKHKIQAETKNQILDCFVTANVPLVNADRDGIEQVVTNILTNSIKYTPENGNIKVYVGSVHDDAYIKIIDNGIGIPEEDLPRVFERFYRVDKARSREMGGTGLGLPIAKEIIEANGGSIDMKSEVGKGTEVIIKVPLKQL